MSLLLGMARSGEYRDVADIETALALKEMHIGAELYLAPLRNRLNALCKQRCGVRAANNPQMLD